MIGTKFKKPLTEADKAAYSEAAAWCNATQQGVIVEQDDCYEVVQRPEPTLENRSPWMRPYHMGPSDDYLEAIGQVVVNSAMIESAIRFVIWEYAQLDPNIGRAFTGQARISDLLLMLRAIVKTKNFSQKMIEEIDAICTEIRSLFQQRGRYVHGIWGVGRNGASLGKFSLTRDVKNEDSEDVPLEEVRALANKMAAMYMRLISHSLPDWARLLIPKEIVDSFFPTPWLDKRQ